MPNYTVKQGDCISSIAGQSGFFWDTLWNHPSNSTLKNERQNPNALLPGDSVFIPDKRKREEQCSCTMRHTFRIKGVPVSLNLQMLDGDGDPRPGIPYTLIVDGASHTGTTDSDGKISENIKPNSKTAKLTLTPSNSPVEQYQFQLGYMNPVDDVRGLQCRLQNLGYLKSVTGQMDDATADAVRRFQTASGLPGTGESDAATQSALAGMHGG